MSFGIEVSDGAGAKTLGMDDFTIQRLASFVVAGSKTSGTGVRTDSLVYNIPGYDPATCFVMITPRVYANYAQPGYDDNWGYTPTYKDLGGSQIGIIRYMNYKQPTGVGGNTRDAWIEKTVECVVEVVKVI
jgi:hypothetical protein